MGGVEPMGFLRNGWGFNLRRREMASVRILKGKRCQAGSMKTTWIGSVLDGAEDGMVVTLRGWVRRMREGTTTSVSSSCGTPPGACNASSSVTSWGMRRSRRRRGAHRGLRRHRGHSTCGSRAPGGYELSATQFEVVGGVDPERPPSPSRNLRCRPRKEVKRNSSSITGTCTSGPSE